MCGDSRSHADVLKLMNGRRADLCITDPPYNVAYEGGGTDDSLTIDNDSMEDQTFYTFLRQCFDVMISVMRPGVLPFMFFHADSEGENFPSRFSGKAGFKLAQCCVWSKNSLMGRQYQWKHEPVLYGRNPVRTGIDRNKPPVWNFDKPQEQFTHHEPFLCLTLSVTLPGEVVGSGTYDS